MILWLNYRLQTESQNHSACAPQLTEYFNATLIRGVDLFHFSQPRRSLISVSCKFIKNVKNFNETKQLHFMMPNLWVAEEILTRNQPGLWRIPGVARRHSGRRVEGGGRASEGGGQADRELGRDSIHFKNIMKIMTNSSCFSEWFSRFFVLLNRKCLN